MKKLLIAFALLVSVGAGAQISQVSLQASGLTCAMCSKAIYKSLEKLPFAQSVQSNIAESSFAIQVKDGANVDPDAVKEAVEAAGFSVANLKLTVQFDGVQVANDTHLKLGGKNLHFVGVKPQTLQGKTIVTVVDKDFVADKTYKKYSALTKMECIKTGVMENCCTKTSTAGDNRIYHITI